MVTSFLLLTLLILWKIYLNLSQTSICQLSITRQYIRLFVIGSTCCLIIMKKKKIRYTLSIAIIVAVNQVSQAKTDFIKDYKPNQAKNSITCLFNTRKNALYTTKQNINQAIILSKNKITCKRNLKLDGFISTVNLTIKKQCSTISTSMKATIQISLLSSLINLYIILLIIRRTICQPSIPSKKIKTNNFLP